ncbi:3-hydroxyacyl-CoA dehydrogenase family protein [Streptacidiphilus sp. PAMC 29251]
MNDQTEQTPATEPAPDAPTSPFPVVAVVGLGTMGAGIAEITARSGRRVIGIELDAAAAEAALRRIEESTAHSVERARITAEERTALLARIDYVTHDLAAAAEAQLVIEEIPEQLELKRELFAELDRICPAGTVLATGTTALSVTRIAAATQRPERVVGLHFFNPAPVMELVEVVRTVLTSTDVAEAAAGFSRSLGKSPVLAGDRAGFIVNGLLFAYLNQAAAMFESRYATREDIDAAMRFGCGLPMGPLALLDLIGVDTAKTVLEAMYEQSHDRLHAPAPILGQLAAAGLLGRKTGRGFYTYAAPGSSQVVAEQQVTRPGPVGRDVRSVGVCGSGTMATGIAEVFAKAGYQVTLVARSQEKADRALAGLAKSLARMVDKGRLSGADRDAALARVTPSGSLEALADADLVLEAVAEDLAVKRELFATLDKICRPGAVLATTTSSLPVIQCATATGRPRDVVGMHFFNPAPAMRLVEVVSTVLTGEDVTATVLEVCAKVRKHPVECGDRAGFIVNALLFPYLNDAVRMVEEHYASVDDVDTAMRLGCGYPMGPFALLDVVGLDVSLTIEKVLHGEFREPGLAPAPLLEHLVAAGCLGRKTGRGFRDHARR